jgi:KDO2-lipid IV(A) lauroyltransferase
MNKVFNILFKGFFYVLSLLPFSVLYLISDILFFLVYHVAAYRKKIVFDNISGSFPNKSTKEVESISKNFYKHFIDSMIESIKLLSISESQLKKRYRHKNADELNTFYDKNKNVILYMGHYGNWEWNAILPLVLKFKILTFYQTLKSSLFDDLIKNARERFGITASESEKGFKTMLSFWKNNVNTCTMMVGDQSPHVGRDRHWVKFLNRDTAFLTGVDRIAQKFEHVIVFLKVKKIKRGFYENEFIILEENSKSVPPGKIIDDFAHELEKTITEDPALWLWSHRRWKLNREELGE